MDLPTIIQGGMGVGVSNWRLAQAVSAAGQLGVVSGTALDQVLARRLQDGDPGGDMRRALDYFPVPAIAKRILRAFYIPGGKSADQPYLKIPAPAQDASRESVELYIAANFAEVFLSREGHGKPVGINYLEKIQAPHLPSIYGAMLAGVDYVLMGAGIPLRIPGVLDRFVHHEPAEYPFQVTGAMEGDSFTLKFNPRDYIDLDLPALNRPCFLAIVASNTLAITLLKKANGRVDGFVVEGPIAGGHNAPPRGKLQLTEAGEPIYGERDQVDLGKLRELGVPFWLAGGFGSPEKLQEALKAGATGIQLGTVFAFCEESGLRREYKDQVLRGATVFTDPAASPTGFPFKVVSVEDTASEREIYRSRPRVCDLGYLREAYRMESGGIGYRCSGEPVTVYVSKGGKAENTAGRKCLCNGLLANIGHPQVRNKFVEPGLVTAGDDLAAIQRLLPSGGLSYPASEVVNRITEQNR
jgi:nitronate monooxygenase